MNLYVTYVTMLSSMYAKNPKIRQDLDEVRIYLECIESKSWVKVGLMNVYVTMLSSMYAKNLKYGQDLDEVRIYP